MEPDVAPGGGLIAEEQFPLFLQRCVIRDPECNLTVDGGYAAWRIWADRRGGFAVLNRRWFTAQMRVHKLAAHTFRDSGVAVYLGLRVRSTAEILASAVVDFQSSPGGESK